MTMEAAIVSREMVMVMLVVVIIAGMMIMNDFVDDFVDGDNNESDILY